jgi:hypothetical protein
VADLFDKLQARRDGILAIPEETRRDLTAVWKEEVLEDLVQALEGITKPEALCFLHGQIRLARNFIQMRWKEPLRKINGRASSETNID